MPSSGLLSCQTALAVGAALSPTSLGFSAQLLGEVGELTTPIGHLICTAAVIDDVLSLLLLAEVDALGEDDPKVGAWRCVRNVRHNMTEAHRNHDQIL